MDKEIEKAIIDLKNMEAPVKTLTNWHIRNMKFFLNHSKTIVKCLKNNLFSDGGVIENEFDIHCPEHNGLVIRKTSPDISTVDETYKIIAKEMCGISRSLLNELWEEKRSCMSKEEFYSYYGEEHEITTQCETIIGKDK